MPKHDHGIGITNHSSSATGSWDYEVNQSSGYAGTELVSKYAGSGAAHNNMPPYLKRYCWQRTA